MLSRLRIGYYKYQENRILRARNYRKNNPEKIRQYRIENVDKIRIRDRKRVDSKFGVERPTFWLCEICNQPISGPKLCLDHSHDTGLFRGWLCAGCNAKLGWFENRFDTIIEHLQKGVC